MKKLDENITLDEIKQLLVDEVTRAHTLQELKEFNPNQDDVKGLIELLKKHHWDYNIILKYESNITEEFNVLLSENNKSNWLWLKIAAVFIAIIGVSSIFYFFSQSPSETEKLYSKYYVPEKGLPILMNSVGNKNFNESMAAFKDDAFDEALKGFSELLKNNPKNDTLRYFVACSNLELGHTNEAIQDFNKIETLSIFKEKTDFKLALIYIKEDKIEDAKRILKEISINHSHEFYSKANEILNESIFQ